MEKLTLTFKGQGAKMRISIADPKADLHAESVRQAGVKIIPALATAKGQAMETLENASIITTSEKVLF